MGSWGTAISSNDTFADVYADFFEQYNDGIEVSKITDSLVKSNQDIINDADDSNNFWFALAKAQWECQKLDPSVFAKVKDIVEIGSDIVVWRELGADKTELNKRKITLEKFLNELSKERPTARTRKKKIIRQPAFAKGDCITFKLQNGNYGGAVILEAIYNSPYAHNLVATTALNQPIKPVLQDFANANVITLSFAAWKNRPLLNWILPIRFKNVEHLFEKIENIKVEVDYDIKKLDYPFSGDFEPMIYLIDRQFEHQLDNSKPGNIITIKQLITKNKPRWKFW